MVELVALLRPVVVAEREARLVELVETHLVDMVELAALLRPVVVAEREARLVNMVELFLTS